MVLMVRKKINYFAAGKKFTAIDITQGTTQELSFAAHIATSVSLQTEEDKTTFVAAVVTKLEESADGT